ncbi:Flagellar biosynthetic protein fliP precursor [Providencia stuartii]|nr:Flagellar biosynthetic protein fliP precursor [Providencia stuartii]
MSIVSNEIPMLALVSLATLLPFIIAAGTCYLKISIVLIMVRNAMGVQQVPSTMALNGIAMLLSLFVMMPVVQDISHYMREEKVDFGNVESVDNFVDGGLGRYKAYLQKYSDPELVQFFRISTTAAK